MRKHNFLFPFILTLAIGTYTSCSKSSDDDDDSGDAPVPAEPTAPLVDPVPSAPPPTGYADQAKWLCLPGRDDICAAEPSSSEILADGTFRAVPPPSAPDDSVDCFFVHPTSDLSVKPGNSGNFEYLEPVEQLAKMQAAPFRSACRIYAPLYRQVTIGTYVLPEEERKPYLDVALSDIREAFDFYMANYNNGRKIVLIGHSQGSEMLTNILKEKFDPVPTMRSQLLLAILPGYGIHVPLGANVGSTFQNIPACTTAGEVGCVIAFRSYKSGTLYLGDGNISLLSTDEELCVNPATLDNPEFTLDDRRTTRVPLSGTLLPPTAWVSDSVRTVSSPTPFVTANGAYSAACASGPDPRNRFLSIEENLPETDPRHGLVLLDSEALTGITGLHTLDLQFPMAELVALVRTRR